MSNLNDVKHKKTFININGKEVEIKYTLNSFAELEEKYGSVDKAMEALNTNSFKAIINFIWAGLIHQDPNLKPEDVGNALTMDNLEEITASIGLAFKSSTPSQTTVSKVPNAVAQKPAN